MALKQVMSLIIYLKISWGKLCRRQILGVVATPFTMLTTHQNAPEAYPSLTSYAADH